MFKNIFKNKKSVVGPLINNETQPFVNPKYVELEKKVKEGSYQDRMDVMGALEHDRDRDSKSIEILAWIIRNGSSHTGDVLKFNERSLAISALGRIGGEPALRALEAVNGEPSLETPIKYAIIEIQKSQDVESLIEGLKTSPVPTFVILMERGDDAGVEKAMELLDSSNITTAVYAARYLGVVQYQPAVEKLIKMLQSDYIDIQHSVAVALGRIGGPKAKIALLDALNHKSEWAVSGAVKGLAFMWANGESDVLEKIGDHKQYLDHKCSRDDGEEQDVQREAVNNMFFSLSSSPAVAISGAEIINTDKSKVTYFEKCDACGYISPKQYTSTIPYKGEMQSFLNCPNCKNRQAVVIKGPK